mgnify:CR=1 FL=1
MRQPQASGAVIVAVLSWRYYGFRLDGQYSYTKRGPTDSARNGTDSRIPTRMPPTSSRRHQKAPGQRTITCY